MIDLRSDIWSRPTPYGAGSTRTAFGTYLPALLVAGAFCLVVSLLVVTLSKPGKPNVVAATA
jgi:hypothetical protein